MTPTADLVQEELSCHVINKPCAIDLLERERDGFFSCISALSRLEACHQDDLPVHRVGRVVQLLYRVNFNNVRPWRLCISRFSWNSCCLLYTSDAADDLL